MAGERHGHGMLRVNPPLDSPLRCDQAYKEKEPTNVWPDRAAYCLGFSQQKRQQETSLHGLSTSFHKNYRKVHDESTIDCWIGLKLAVNWLNILCLAVSLKFPH
jgi:hypothetical protein